MFKVPFYVLLFAGSLLNVWSLDICEDQEDGARLAHPADCSRFIQCEGGETMAIRFCPFGLHFNRYESICDFKFRAGCDFSYALQLVGQDNSNQLDCEACRAKCNGIGPVRPPGRPSRPGQRPGIPCLTAPTPKPSTPPTPTPCPSKPTTPTKPTAPTPCPTKPTRPPPPAPPSKPCPPSGSEGGNGKPETPPSPPVTGPSGVSCADPGKCQGQNDGALFADDSSSGFIVCQCQCEIKMPCPAGLVFDAALQVCDWPQS